MLFVLPFILEAADILFKDLFQAFAVPGVVDPELSETMLLDAGSNPVSNTVPEIPLICRFKGNEIVEILKGMLPEPWEDETVDHQTGQAENQQCRNGRKDKEGIIKRA